MSTILIKRETLGEADDATAAEVASAISPATTSLQGALSAADKTKLDGLTSTVDSAVAVETARAEAAEATNATAITTETSRATAAEGLKVSKAGDTMTGALTLPGNPVSNLQAAPKQYVDAKVSKTGDTMTGALILSGNPAFLLQAAPKQYVDGKVGDETTRATAAEAGKVSKTGDTMTGTLTLSGDPTIALHASTKQYVDTETSIARTVEAMKVDKAGDTMTGALTLPGDPTTNLQAATKQYVDTHSGGGGGGLPGFQFMFKVGPIPDQGGASTPGGFNTTGGSGITIDPTVTQFYYLNKIDQNDFQFATLVNDLVLVATDWLIFSRGPTTAFGLGRIDSLAATSDEAYFHYTAIGGFGSFGANDVVSFIFIPLVTTTGFSGNETFANGDIGTFLNGLLSYVTPAGYGGS
jgi:hypothetical protein